MENGNRFENRKSIYRLFAVTAITAIVTAPYAYLWYTFFNGLMDREFLKKGNWLMIAIYAVLILIVFTPFRGFKISS